MSELVDLAVVGMLSAIPTALLIESERRFVKIRGDNEFKSKGVATIAVLICYFVIGTIVNEVPELLRQEFVYYELQAFGLILVSAWLLVHILVTDWNLELPSPEDPYEILVLLGGGALLLPFLLAS